MNENSNENDFENSLLQDKDKKINGKNDPIILYENSTLKDIDSIGVKAFTGENGSILVVLRYTVRGIEFDAIMGTLENTVDKMNNFKFLEAQIKKQLNYNANGINNNLAINEILSKLDEMKFKFTLEGMELIVNRNKDLKFIKRTKYRNLESNGLKLESLVSDEEEKAMFEEKKEDPKFKLFSDYEEEQKLKEEKIRKQEEEKKTKYLDELKEEKRIKLLDKLSKKDELYELEKESNHLKKWIRRREIILNKVEREDPIELENFLVGEKIIDSLEEKKLLKDIEKNRTNFIEYLLSNYASEVIENKESILDEYVDFKERNVVEEITERLDKLIQIAENKCQEGTQEPNKMSDLRKYRDDAIIYRKFLNLVIEGEGRDIITYKSNIIDLKKYDSYMQTYNKIFSRTKEDTKNEEIKKYFELKEQELKDLSKEDTLKIIELSKDRRKRTEEYKKYESVRKMYEFLSFTHTDEKDIQEEHQILKKVIGPLERDIIRKNAEAVRAYSGYAVLSNVASYDISELIKHDLDNKILRDNIFFPDSIQENYQIDVEKEVRESKNELPRNERQIEENKQKQDLLIKRIGLISDEISKLDSTIKAVEKGNYDFSDNKEKNLDMKKNYIGSEKER